MAFFAERVRWHIWEEVSPNGAPQGGLLKWTPAWNPTGTRSPAGGHLWGPAMYSVLGCFMALRGGFRPGWTPKKIALTLAKSRASPPRIPIRREGTRKTSLCCAAASSLAKARRAADVGRPRARLSRVYPLYTVLEAFLSLRKVSGWSFAWRHAALRATSQFNHALFRQLTIEPPLVKAQRDDA